MISVHGPLPNVPRALHVRRLLLALSLASLTACAAVERSPTDLASIRRDGDVARAAQRATIERLVDTLARRAVARGDRTLDVLLLSGGGQHGAYGVGFLRGWRTRGDGSMPRFDLVTGISTGALQAPFALLGTDAALDRAAAIYRSAATDSGPTVDWLFWLRRTSWIPPDIDAPLRVPWSSTTSHRGTAMPRRDNAPEDGRPVPAP